MKLKNLIKKFSKRKTQRSIDNDNKVCYNIYVPKKRKDLITIKNLQAVLADYKAKDFSVSNDKIKQTERNQFKADFARALANDLAEAGLEVGKVDKGYAVLVENDALGAIAVVVDAVVKNDLNYDFYHEVEVQAQKDAERQAKMEAKA